jgi:hypothetical protein
MFTWQIPGGLGDAGGGFMRLPQNFQFASSRGAAQVVDNTFLIGPAPF